MIRKRMTDLVLCVLLALATAGGAQAQGVQFNERVVELTEPVLRGLMTGLDLEIALLQEFANLLGTYKTPEQYRTCVAQVQGSPEYLNTMVQQAGNLPENATIEQIQRIGEKVRAETDALVGKRCGANPEGEWPVDKRMQKVDEIHRKAAAAAGLMLSASPPQQRGGPWMDDGGADLAQQAGSTDPYDIAEERVDAYCQAKKARPDLFDTPGYNVSVPGKYIDPNWNQNAYFTAAEIEAIEKDGRCITVTLRIGKIESILEMPPLYLRGRSSIKTRR